MCDPDPNEFDAEFITLVKNCSGAVGANDIPAFWEANNCPQAYARVLNTTNQALVYNPTGQQTVQNCD
jgi:hypothetical protein